jgi:uncharacterized protein (DUF58 family)
MLFIATGLGVAAVNTGNNLLYLLVSMLLGLVVVSGVLSESSIRRTRANRVVPDEIYAGRPTLLGVRVANEKRRLTSYSVTVEVARERGEPRRLYVLRLPAGEERSFTWQETLLRRGRQRLPGIRVTTLFPFGLFLKAGPETQAPEVLVYPRVMPISPAALRQSGGGDAVPTRRRGRGAGLYNLREYRPGDDPRLIHWRSTAKAGALMVRELEAESSSDARIRLEGHGREDRERLEHALSRAASLAVHLLRAGARVELVGPAASVRLGGGTGQERRILRALALYDPETLDGGGAGARDGTFRAACREFPIDLGP